MKYRRLARRLLLAAVLLAVVGIAGLAQAAVRGQSAALFYEALAPHGQWIVYGNYGPVWYPGKVSQDWRPYLDGRWVPTDMGWVFETPEPWGWATYHYGNWMPTLDFGWVWVPGSTWYPSTVAWRTSRDYIGWAPVPPPFFTPPPAFAGGAFLTPGTPVASLLTPFFFTFCPTSSFLLGFGLPFAPAYSFFNCGCLVPFGLFPTFFPSTAFLTNFFSPLPFHSGFFAFGPGFAFIGQVTPVKLVQINLFVKNLNITKVKNLVPPQPVLQKMPQLAEVVPAPLLKGQPLKVEPAADRTLAEKGFLRPDVSPLPAHLPALKDGIPQAITVPFATRVGPEALQGVKGAGLPAKALDPKLAQQVQAAPPVRPAPVPPARPEETARETPRAEVPPAAVPTGEPGRRRGARMIELNREGVPVTRQPEAPRLREAAPPVSPAPEAPVTRGALPRRSKEAVAPTPEPLTPPVAPQPERLQELQRQQQIRQQQLQERQLRGQQELTTRQLRRLEQQRRQLEMRPGRPAAPPPRPQTPGPRLQSPARPGAGVPPADVTPRGGGLSGRGSFGSFGR